MKYIIYVLIIHVVFSISLIGQTQNMKVDYTQVYYPHTSQAKLSISNKDFKKALQHYKIAFKSVRRSFSSDVYNAVICNILIKDYKQASILVDTLLNKGIDIKEIEQKITYYPEIFSSFEKSTEWQKIKIEYPQRKSKYQRPKEKEIRDFFIYLCKLDQKARRVKNGIADTIVFKNKKINTKDGKVIDSLTMSEFKIFIKEKGFPSEDMIGQLQLFESDYPFQLLLLHYTYFKSYHKDFDEMLLNEVKQGNFYVGNYTMLADRYLGAPNYGSKETLYGHYALNCFSEKDVRGKEAYEKAIKECIWRVPKSYLKDEEKININRKKLGINTFSEYLKICIFASENRYFELESFLSLLIVGKNYEQEYKHRVDLLEVIKK